ncbi:hypothetical protein TNCV_3172851 [Trichonephila clavipes]|nr:hypothetical protein TNCV_3172851 [Trichonephila clavipes]
MSRFFRCVTQKRHNTNRTNKVLWNSVLLYQIVGKRVALLEFRVQVVEELYYKYDNVASGQKNPRRPPIVDNFARFTERHFISHIPSTLTKREPTGQCKREVLPQVSSLSLDHGSKLQGPTALVWVQRTTKKNSGCFSLSLQNIKKNYCIKKECSSFQKASEGFQNFQDSQYTSQNIQEWINNP